MLMQAQPVYDAWKAVAGEKKREKPLRVLYMSPQGKPFCQEMAKEFAKEEELVFLCGHYEGIDERVLEEIVTDQVSVGDYVLTGGELPAMVMIDAISRMVPGVLKNEESGVTESFHENLLEYPQYTRPEVWHEKSVPAVLLSGDHAKVDLWRRQKAEERTRRIRPDLYEKYDLEGRALEYLKRDKILHMDMIEDIRRGKARLIAVREDGVLLQDRDSSVYMLTARTKDAGERLLSMTEPEGAQYTCHQKFVMESICARFEKKRVSECFQVVYTKKTPLEEPAGFDIRVLDESFAGIVSEHYDLVDDEGYVTERLRAGVMIGAFVDGRLAGFAGIVQPLGHPAGPASLIPIVPVEVRRGVLGVHATVLLCGRAVLLRRFPAARSIGRVGDKGVKHLRLECPYYLQGIPLQNSPAIPAAVFHGQNGFVNNLSQFFHFVQRHLPFCYRSRSERFFCFGKVFSDNSVSTYSLIMFSAL